LFEAFKNIQNGASGDFSNKMLDQTLPLSDMFEKKSCILKKSKVTDDSSNQERAYKTDGIIFFKMYLFPGFSRYNNDLCLKLTGQNVGRSSRSFLDFF
jgi:hypothetical protein